MSRFYIHDCLPFAAGGIVEAYAYCSCGHVFANIQAGNLLLAAVSLAQEGWGAALHFVLPIAAYCFGAAAFALYQRHVEDIPADADTEAAMAAALKAALLFAPIFSSAIVAAILLSIICGFGAGDFMERRAWQGNAGGSQRVFDGICFAAFVLGILAGMPLAGYLGRYALQVPILLQILFIYKTLTKEMAGARSPTEVPCGNGTGGKRPSALLSMIRKGQQPIGKCRQAVVRTVRKKVKSAPCSIRQKHKA